MVLVVVLVMTALSLVLQGWGLGSNMPRRTRFSLPLSGVYAGQGRHLADA
jgi:hypothetical protein